MIPARQTETEPGRGNCLPACLASVLGVPLADIPNFTLSADPWASMQQWLGARGLFLLAVRFGVANPPPFPESHCLLIGRSPRGDRGHAVVGIADHAGCRMVYDPHPDGTGLDGPPHFVAFLCNLNN